MLIGGDAAGADFLEFGRLAFKKTLENFSIFLANNYHVDLELVMVKMTD